MFHSNQYKIKTLSEWKSPAVECDRLNYTRTRMIKPLIKSFYEFLYIETDDEYLNTQIRPIIINAFNRFVMTTRQSTWTNYQEYCYARCMCTLFERLSDGNIGTIECISVIRELKHLATTLQKESKNCNEFEFDLFRYLIDIKHDIYGYKSQIEEEISIAERDIREQKHCNKMLMKVLGNKTICTLADGISADQVIEQVVSTMEFGVDLSVQNISELRQLIRTVGYVAEVLEKLTFNQDEFVEYAFNQFWTVELSNLSVLLSIFSCREEHTLSLEATLAEKILKEWRNVVNFYTLHFNGMLSEFADWIDPENK
nr:4581_t:CDS:1 [Entrophospora candida]